MASQTTDAGAGDTRIVLLDQTRTARAILGDHMGYRAQVRLFEQNQFDITAPSDSALWTTEYSGASAASTRWANWSADWYFRGTKKFTGPFAAGGIEEPGTMLLGGQPLAYAHLTAVSWLTWILGGRTIQTASGAPWTKNGAAWDDIMRQLVRDQCTSAAVTPPGYPGSRSRGNYGPFTVTVEADTGTASTDDFTIETGKPLLETVLEMCTMPSDLDSDMLWPYMVETSPGTFQFRVLVGRGGAGREIGTDLSASLVFGGQVGTLRRAKTDFDHLAKVGIACCGGQGRGSSRGRTWADSGSSFYTTWGAREDEITIPQAGTATERGQEAQRIINATNEDATATWEVEVQEHTGSQYSVDYDEQDTGIVVLNSTGEKYEAMIVGADVEARAPDPARVKLVFGKYPSDPVRDAQRSGGGGGGGGRKAGGKPKASDGGSAVDPDSIKAFGTVTGDSGSASADTATDSLAIKASTVQTPANWKTEVTDGPEVVGGYVYLNDTAQPTTPTILGFRRVKTDAGLRWLLVVEDGGSGDPFPGDGWNNIACDGGSNPSAAAPNEALWIKGDPGRNTNEIHAHTNGVSGTPDKVEIAVRATPLFGVPDPDYFFWISDGSGGWYKVPCEHHISGP